MLRHELSRSGGVFDLGIRDDDGRLRNGYASTPKTKWNPPRFIHRRFLLLNLSSSMAATVIRFPVPLRLLPRKLLLQSSSLLLLPMTRKLCFEIPCLEQAAAAVTISTDQEGGGIIGKAAEEKSEMMKQQKQDIGKRRKLYVENLPSNFDPDKIQTLFGQCGVVNNVEIIYAKDGRRKDFLFVTMSSVGEAEAAVDKFDSLELEGRIVRVAFARRFTPAPVKTKPMSNRNLAAEKPNQVFASNLSWKVRSNHLRDFFKTNSNAITAGVVFDSPNGRATGYGFVSFATKEDAEAAVEALNGKELMGRPLRLRISQKVVSEDEEGNKHEGASNELVGSVSAESELVLS